MAQGPGVDSLFWRHRRRSLWLATDWHDHRVLRLCGALQWLLSGCHQLSAPDTPHWYLSQPAIHQSGKILSPFLSGLLKDKGVRGSA